MLDGLTQSVTAINHAEDFLIPKDWDVFISHASEDKEEIVRPLLPPQPNGACGYSVLQPSSTEQIDVLVDHPHRATPGGFIEVL